jgi:hypothetical protein
MQNPAAKVTEVIGLRGLKSCGTWTCGRIQERAISLQLSAESNSGYEFGDRSVNRAVEMP